MLHSCTSLQLCYSPPSLSPSLPPPSLSPLRGAVLCVAMSNSGEVCFSGGTDTTIRVWQLPRDLSDAFSIYGKARSPASAESLSKSSFLQSSFPLFTFLPPSLPPSLPLPPSFPFILFHPPFFFAVDPSVHQGVLQGHSDAIWDLAIHPTTGLLLSCAADGTCRLWNHQLTSPQIKLFQAESGTCCFSPWPQKGVLHSPLHP